MRVTTQDTPKHTNTFWTIAAGVQKEARPGRPAKYVLRADPVAIMTYSSVIRRATRPERDGRNHLRRVQAHIRNRLNSRYRWKKRNTSAAYRQLLYKFVSDHMPRMSRRPPSSPSRAEFLRATRQRLHYAARGSLPAIQSPSYLLWGIPVIWIPLAT